MGYLWGLWVVGVGVGWDYSYILCYSGWRWRWDLTSYWRYDKMAVWGG